MFADLPHVCLRKVELQTAPVSILVEGRHGSPMTCEGVENPWRMVAFAH